MQIYRREKFLDELTIKHGPRDLFARFFLQAVHEATERGIFLEFGSFEELFRVNQKNNKDWRTLFPSFQPGLGGANEDNGFVLFGRDRDGDVVATQAVRLFDWQDTNLKREAQSLRLFYADPARSAIDEEACMVTAEIAGDVTGRVGFGGAVWYRSDYRRNGFGYIMPRIVRAYAMARYNLDHIVAFFAPENIERGVHRRAGYIEASSAVILKHSPTYRAGELAMTVCRQKQMQCIDDTFGWLLQRIETGLQVELGEQRRRA